MKFLLVFLFLTSLAVTGCRGFFSQMVDIERHENGIDYHFPFTLKNWLYFTDLINRRVEKEAAGRKPDAGIETWDLYWKRRLETYGSKKFINSERYVKYLIERRQRAGLPPLKLE